MTSQELWFALPASFAASQAYSPRWFDWSEAKVSVELYGSSCLIAMPSLAPSISSGRPSLNQRMLTGRSPRTTVHMTLYLWPRWSDFANEKGSTTGGTEFRFGRTKVRGRRDEFEGLMSHDS